MKDSNEVLVVRMTPKHFDQVTKIAQKAFTNPWKESDYLELQITKGIVSIVALVEDEVAGFLIYENHREFIYLLQTAVAEKYSRLGIVSGLVQYLKTVARKSKRRIESDVPENARHFMSLMNKQGFSAIGINRDQFEHDGRPIDGYQFVYNIPLDDLLPESVEEEFLPVE